MPTCPRCGEQNPEHARFCLACAAQLATPEQESRRQVTIFFCDLAESTAMGERLDPETLRRVLSLYHGTAQQVIERHGGTLEKFIGDAVMAVFGVPVLHEDDALRAVRAAAALRERIGLLNEELERVYGTRLAVRIGVNTGEVVAGTEEHLATGDAVNVAARLEQSAAPDEILIGAETLALVREAVTADAVDPLVVKGKSEPLTAWRLVAVQDEDQLARRFDVPMVGREQEIRRLLDAFERARRDRRCQIVTILGPAGVGKSRLAREFLASIDGAAVVHGRCIPYGEGITYLPVVEVVRQLEARLDQLPLDADVLATLRRLLDAQATTDSTEEIAYAVRKLLEATAREVPLVCVLDDIQWGEPAFLELVEQVAALSHEASLLLCCIARSDLLERNPGWVTGHLNDTTVVLEPLSSEETGELIERLSVDAPLTDPVQRRVRQAAEGNPLFVEEMIAFLRNAPDGEVAVPGTIATLLGARLDQLEPSERAVLQRGAVEGRVFHRGAIRALGPDEAHVGARLTALVRKELIRPNRPQLAGEDAFRFRHLLIRDAAYDSLPKEARARLHERLADWLEERRSELVEADEIVGYHLEHAHRYRVELRPHDDHGRRGLALRASELLSAAGGRALGRNDVAAALKLLTRALALLPDDAPAVDLRIDLSEALLFSGELAAANELLGEAAARAAASGDESGALRARLMALRISTQAPRHEEGARAPTNELLDVAHVALPVFQQAGDERGITDSWLAIAWAQMIRCHWREMLEALDNVQVHAQRAGIARWERELAGWRSTALFYGPTPVAEVLRWHEEQPSRHPVALQYRAVLEAMNGSFDDARALIAGGNESAEELGQTLLVAAGGMAAWEVETLAGDAIAAEACARHMCEQLEQLGDTGMRSLASGQLAESLYQLGRLDEAMKWTETAQQLSSEDDVGSQMVWRQVRAKIRARQADFVGAEQLAREAVSLAEQSDMLNWHASALADLAEVLALSGRHEDAAVELGRAIDLYQRKGNAVAEAQTRRRLAELQEAAPATG
jgi:class 3 adenylate cyclase/tetratricopeptide (TPR) repeat protein